MLVCGSTCGDALSATSSQFYGRAAGDDDDTDVCSHTLRDGRFKHFIVSDKANGESAQISLLQVKQSLFSFSSLANND